MLFVYQNTVCLEPLYCFWWQLIRWWMERELSLFKFQCPSDINGDVTGLLHLISYVMLPLLETIKTYSINLSHFKQSLSVTRELISNGKCDLIPGWNIYSKLSTICVTFQMFPSSEEIILLSVWTGIPIPCSSPIIYRREPTIIQKPLLSGTLSP